MNLAPSLPLQQHPYFAAALRALDQPVTAREIGAAACLISLKRFGIRFASRGPIWQPGTTVSDRADCLRRSGLKLVNADRYDPEAYRHAGFYQINTPGSVAELDLRGTTNTIAARTHAKWRNIWRRGQSSPLTFHRTRFAPHKHAWIFEAEAAQQRQRGYRTLPHDLVAAFANCRPKDVIVHLALDDDAPVAAMLFLLHHPVATYHLGWANAAARRQGAHHQMLMMAANKLQRHGFRRLDLGQVATDAAPGLARFKIGTGAIVRPLGGTWLKAPGR